jgi:hypothetical protein
MKKLVLLSAAIALSACASVQNTVERTAITSARADFPQFSAPMAKAENAARQRVDHAALDQFLATYLVETPVSNSLSEGASLIRYQAVTAADKQALVDYIDRLQATKVSVLPRDEQLAFWINLYNAETIRVILDNMPVETIRAIKSGPFDFKGPWNDVRLSVEGTPLSLDDIENKIVRPVFKDPRIHYGLNCAAIGCPSLRARAFTGDSLDRALDEQTRAFINTPRGASVEAGKLTVSRIFLWYADDYGEGPADIINHLRQYAEPPLRDRLDGVNKIARYEYDWSLNDAGRLEDTYSVSTR